ncbi:MAG TPA: glycosyltransferase family 39 protein [Solirubrobacteraceae bacterium]|jgi:4-amino-4-deoxy-L-arabinose transferase-like glycosyltransferase|nr:glycosyltransferase family 39 protein [Solirubrobacteraceae bacterium]
MSFSWRPRTATSPTGSAPPVASAAGVEWAPRVRRWTRPLAALARYPELASVMSLAAILNLWALSRNGFANQYYAAAVKSMSSSWHDFLYASLDRGGIMTVDKPPLALWVQALSARVFGFDSLSILVPQALMGVASVALVYDLVRRRFGRVGGFVAGLSLALTPISVAISRHNNPDSLLVLCCVAALWCTVRGLDADPARRGTRWLVLAGVFVGLGFETKMGVALVVVPGIVAAWLWVAPAARGRLHALRQLLAGGAAMLLVGGAWPLLVELTPAADRPWVSGTSNNSVLSLIFEYNGLGRVEGQTGGAGGPPNGANTMFGGTAGPLRLLNSALGGQAGWLLGFAVISGLGILVASRLRRSDTRSGWLLAIGGAFVATAVLFSFAGGIFHPYYVSLLAPFVAALTGAGAAQMLRGGRAGRVMAALAVVAGVVVEFVVRADYPGQLTWLPPVLIVVGALAVVALLAFSSRAVRIGALAAVLAALLAAPAVWAFDTLGHATSGTFPAGGPASVEAGGPGGPGGSGGGFGGARGVGGSGGGFGPGGGAGGGPRGFGAGTPPSGAPGAAAGAGPGGTLLFGSGSARAGGIPDGAASRAGGQGGAMGAPIGGSVTTSILTYVKQHGGGTIAVASQSNAASSILIQNANVAGIGGFSGRESDVSVSWLASEVRAGKIRWVLDEQGSTGTARGLPGDTRTGAKTAMKAVAKACVAVTLPSSGSGSGSASGAANASSAAATLYDCQGRASALASVGT